MFSTENDCLYLGEWKRKEEKTENVKEGTDEDLGKKKGGISQLEITVKAYSPKTLPSLAKEPDETTCVPDMSRCIFHNLC